MEAKPFNKYIGYVRKFFWYPLLIMIVTQILGALARGPESTLPHWIFWILVPVQIFGFAVLPLMGIIFCIYGLRTMNREKEEGFRDGVIRLVILALFFCVIVIASIAATVYSN